MNWESWSELVTGFLEINWNRKKNHKPHQDCVQRGKNGFGEQLAFIIYHTIFYVNEKQIT